MLTECGGWRAGSQSHPWPSSVCQQAFLCLSASLPLPVSLSLSLSPPWPQWAAAAGSLGGQASFRQPAGEELLTGAAGTLMVCTNGLVCPHFSADGFWWKRGKRRAHVLNVVSPLSLYFVFAASFWLLCAFKTYFKPLVM